MTKIQNKGWKILYLRRENLLGQFVSNIFAEASGTYHYSIVNTRKKPDKIYLPPDRMLKSIEARKKNLDLERLALNGLDYLELCYEQDLLNRELQSCTFSRIQSYLGVEQETLHPTLRKAVNKPLREVVTNYLEVEQILRNTPYEHFLDN